MAMNWRNMPTSGAATQAELSGNVDFSGMFGGGSSYPDQVLNSYAGGSDAAGEMARMALARQPRPAWLDAGIDALGKAGMSAVAPARQPRTKARPFTGDFGGGISVDPSAVTFEAPAVSPAGPVSPTASSARGLMSPPMDFLEMPVGAMNSTGQLEDPKHGEQVVALDQEPNPVDDYVMPLEPLVGGNPLIMDPELEPIPLPPSSAPPRLGDGLNEALQGFLQKLPGGSQDVLRQPKPAMSPGDQLFADVRSKFAERGPYAKNPYGIE